MTEEEIRKFADQLIRAEIERAIEEATQRQTDHMLHVVKQSVSEAVRQTLIQLGITPDNPLAVQRNMQFLNSWRETTESIQSKTILTVLGLFIAGIGALIVMGLKEMMK